MPFVPVQMLQEPPSIIKFSLPQEVPRVEKPSPEFADNLHKQGEAAKLAEEDPSTPWIQLSLVKAEEPAFTLQPQAPPVKPKQKKEKAKRKPKQHRYKERKDVMLKGILRKCRKFYFEQFNNFILA